MACKAILALCASALLVNVISGQSLGIVNAGLSELTNTGTIGNGLPGCGPVGPGWAANGLGLGVNGLGLAANGLASSSGGSFTVSSASPIAPSGLSVVSENALDGPVAVSGGLPFLSAIGLEGQVPASGASGVSYNCGNGNVGIVSENIAPAAGVGVGSGLRAGLGGGLGSGLGSPLAGRALGANVGAFGGRARGVGAGVY